MWSHLFIDVCSPPRAPVAVEETRGASVLNNIYINIKCLAQHSEIFQSLKCVSKVSPQCLQRKDL